jgi:hypothetical protein
MTVKMPSIPTPVKGSADSTQEVLLAMKQALELMMGTRGNQPVTRTFLQDDKPSAIAQGDLWITSNGRASYWSGRDWLLLQGNGAADFVVSDYVFANTFAPPPDIGQLRGNNATVASITHLYANHRTALGTAIGNYMKLAATAGRRVYVQDQNDEAIWAQWSISGAPTDNPSYLDIPVTFINQGSPLKAQRLFFTLI